MAKKKRTRRTVPARRRTTTAAPPRRRSKSMSSGKLDMKAVAIAAGAGLVAPMLAPKLPASVAPYAAYLPGVLAAGAGIATKNKMLTGIGVGILASGIGTQIGAKYATRGAATSMTAPTARKRATGQLSGMILDGLILDGAPDLTKLSGAPDLTRLSGAPDLTKLSGEIIEGQYEDDFTFEGDGEDDFALDLDGEDDFDVDLDGEDEEQFSLLGENIYRYSDIEADAMDGIDPESDLGKRRRVSAIRRRLATAKRRERDPRKRRAIDAVARGVARAAQAQQQGQKKHLSDVSFMSLSHLPSYMLVKGGM